MRYAKVRNLQYKEDGYWLWLDVVKGQNTYGEARHVPVLPFGESFVERYLESRNALLEELGLKSDALIPSLVEDAPFTSDKTLRKLKDHASRDIGLEFDLRILRCTFAQYLVDSEVDFSVVQRAMGHNNPNTAYKNYAGIRTERVPHMIFKKLSNNKKGGA